METRGSTSILPSRVPAGAAAISAVSAALEAAECVAIKRNRSCALTTRAEWIEDSFDSLGHLQIDGRTTDGFMEHSGFFRTGDGWIRTHGNYPHHRAALLDALSLPASAGRADVATTLRDLPTGASVEHIVAAGGIAAPVLSPAEWMGHPAVGEPGGSEGRAIAVHAADRVGTVSGRSGLMSPWPDRPHGDLPLSGLRVVSLARVIAGPTAARFLGALGAQVMRIDPPWLPELDDQRLDTDFGVHVRTADLRTAEGAAAFQRLLGSADGLITGYRPRSLDRFGLTADALAVRHPHLAVARIRAWDPAGAWAARRGFDSIVQAASGIAHVCGSAGAPGALPAQVLDHVTGYRAAAAILRMWADGAAGVREFALTDPAFELLRAQRTQTDVTHAGLTAEARRAETTVVASSAGSLRHVPPPVAVNGRRLEYAFAPESAEPLV